LGAPGASRVGAVPLPGAQSSLSHVRAVPLMTRRDTAFEPRSRVHGADEVFVTVSVKCGDAPTG
jgi:hypothetical protein